MDAVARGSHLSALMPCPHVAGAMLGFYAVCASGPLRWHEPRSVARLAPPTHPSPEPAQHRTARRPRALEA